MIKYEPKHHSGLRKGHLTIHVCLSHHHYKNPTSEHYTFVMLRSQNQMQRLKGRLCHTHETTSPQSCSIVTALFDFWCLAREQIQRFPGVVQSLACSDLRRASIKSANLLSWPFKSASEHTTSAQCVHGWSVGNPNVTVYSYVLDNHVLSDLWNSFEEGAFLFQRDYARSISVWKYSIYWPVESPELRSIQQFFGQTGGWSKNRTGAAVHGKGLNSFQKLSAPMCM